MLGSKNLVLKKNSFIFRKIKLPKISPKKSPKEAVTPKAVLNFISGQVEKNLEAGGGWV